MKINKGMKRCDGKSQHKFVRSLSCKNRVMAKSSGLYTHSTAKSGRRETKNYGTGPR